MGLFLSFLLDGLALGGLYAGLAVGYALAFRRHRILHLPYADIGVFSVFLTVLLLAAVGPEKPGSLLGPLLFLLGVGVSSLIAAVLGFLTYRLIYRPLSQQPLLHVVAAALGLALLLENLALAIWGAGGRPFPDLLELGQIGLLGATLPVAKLLAVVLSLALAWISYSLFGSRPDASFFLLGVPAGAIAFVAALYYGVSWYFLGFLLGLSALVSAAAAGFSNLTRVALIALGLGIVQGLAAGYLSSASGTAAAQLPVILPAAALVGALVFRRSRPLPEDQEARSGSAFSQG